MSSPKKGFTLFEILIIVSLAGAVSLGSSFGLTRQFVKIRDTQRKVHIKAIQTALTQYYDSTLCYPSNLPACGLPLKIGTTTLIYSMPCDPLTGNAYPYDVVDNVCNNEYKIYTRLEMEEDRDIEYVGCSNGCGQSCFYNFGLSSPNTDLLRCPEISVPEISPTLIPEPSTYLGEYVCAPGVGNEGHCTMFEFPELSDCPRIYLNDPTCNMECINTTLRCKNSKGKNKN